MIGESFNERSAGRRRGQTLAEFALTLPILLMLTFGIIEFGRLFQSWVTLQNAAREAARYTTTGQFDEAKYSMDLLPCDLSDPVGERFDHYPDSDDTSYVVEAYGLPNPDATYDITPKSLFATWYDGEVCDPGRPEHDEYRKDILRLASIMDVARRGAAGLSLEPNPRNGDFDSLHNMLFSVWEDPLPRSDIPRWFDVSVCSSRTMMRSASVSHDPQANPNQRFVTVYDSDSAPASANREYEAPYCMLNEAHPDSLTNLDDRPPRNQGTRWLDPGGPGDRITVFVVYNHPLITPLGLAEYVRMESRRSGVNESFRASRALNAVQGSPPGASNQASPTPRPPTETPLPTETWTPTSTMTPTPTATPTSTLGPFTCDNLYVGDLSFDRERVYFSVTNTNVQPTELDRVQLVWKPSSVYTGMFLSAMAVNSNVVWMGEHASPQSIDSNSFTGTDRDRFDNAERGIPGNGARSRFEGVFLNAGNNLGSHLKLEDFGGSVFEFYDTSNDLRCVIEADIVTDDTDPDDPDDPDTPQNTPTPTYTPDCASESMRVRVDRFDTFGVVVLRVESLRHQPSPMFNFHIDWTQAKNKRSWLTLERISIGGSHAHDTQFGVEIWRGNSTGPTTTPNDPSTTYWRGADGGTYPTVYTFPPFSTTYVYLDFGGTSTDLATHGIAAWMFNNTYFDILCIDPGGEGDGSGDPDSGSIYTEAFPTPTPVITNTPEPTPIPGNLVIDKVVDWDGNPSFSYDPFTICVSGPEGFDSCFDLSDGQNQSFSNLRPGTYNITEDPGSLWSASGTGSITVESNQTAERTVRNVYVPPPPTNTPAPPGSLTVSKSINWDGNDPVAVDPFNICVSGPDGFNQCVNLADGQDHTFNDLPVGTYNVSETDPGERWEVSGTGNVTVQSEQTASKTVTNTYIPEQEDDTPPGGYDPGDGEDASQG